MEFLTRYWPQIAGVLALTASVVTSAHAILYKRHVRAVVSWMGLIWVLPVVGATMYVLLGINRVRRRAVELRGRDTAERRVPGPPIDRVGNLLPLARLVGYVSRRQLLPGNSVELLQNGDAAFPAMLDAIDRARRSVALCMYIFEPDEVGSKFVEALARAHDRGVEVRVLIDGVGERYSFPRLVSRELKRRGVNTRLFLWTWNPFRMPYINLRNHRKMLIIDGEEAYTGGMNIRRHHVLAEQSDKSTACLMARIRGPVVEQLMEVFATDWRFTCKEELSGDTWFPPLREEGPVLARALPDGPDEDFDVAARTFAGALSNARTSARILTPYFLPEEELEVSLENAALGGVEVDVVVPEATNLAFINRAMLAELPGLITRRVRAWFAPAPFDHTKLMVVDEQWVCLGSANWDERSLRLNFELNLECYHEGLAREADALIRERRDRSRLITLAELENRPLPLRLLDGVLRLFKPYL